MKKILPILFLLIFIIALSGCVGDRTQGGSSNGLIIQRFTADPDTVEGGEIVYFTTDVKNVGGAKAEGISAELIGLPWSVSPLSESGCTILYPPEEGVEGETCTFEWQGTAPSADTTMTYPVDVKVNYNYATHYDALVRVASRDWIRSLPQDQQESERNKLGISQESAHIGPIHATLKLRTNEVYSGRNAYVYIYIQNVGSGRPENDMVNVAIEGLSGCSKSGAVKLSQGQSTQIRCQLGTGGIDKWKSAKVGIDLSYRYWVKSTTEVTVLAKPIE